MNKMPRKTVFVLLILALFILVRGTRHITCGPCGEVAPAPKGPLHLSRTRIFVSVPSYRDSACNETLESLFSKAEHPERIVVGACEQNSDREEESCMRGKNVPRGEVRLVSIPANRARGPCSARYLCATLLRDEEVYLQVDSHSVFAEHWDTKAVKMLNTMPYSLGAAVISTHPVDSAIENWETHDAPVITEAHWDGNFLTFQGTFRRPGFWHSRQIGAGFMLCHSSVMKKIPLDPGLDGLFNNEEILYSARLYTNGVEILSPSCNIVAHKYTYEGHLVVWDETGFSWDAGTTGKRRAEMLLLGNGRAGDPYGMGAKRSLADFWRTRKIDFRTKKIEKFETSISY